MNGPHDMGGFTSFGRVDPEPNEPVFHATWEARAFAIVLAIGATEGWPSNRPFREAVPPLKYWSSNYYEIWLAALERILAERGLVQELDRAPVPVMPVRGVLKAAQAPAFVAEGGPDDTASNIRQKFQVGEKVRTRNFNPGSHTRLPRYARGRSGEVTQAHGIFSLPDSQTQQLGDDPQWLYTVRFTSRELWGKDTQDSVYIDLWEPYLEAL